MKARTVEAAGRSGCLARSNAHERGAASRRRPHQPGVFITFEGNEGSGKTTQVRLLYNYLRRKGRRVFLTREPGGTRIGDGIREILLDNRNRKMTPVCETLLYMAARAQVAAEVIRPKLKDGYVVLCDRWLDATVAYQGYGAGVDLGWIRSLGEKVTAGVKPDRTIFLDLPLAVGLRRARGRKPADRMESKDTLFHQKVRRGYLRIAAGEPGRFKIVKVLGNDPAGAVHEKIKKALRHAF